MLDEKENRVGVLGWRAPAVEDFAGDAFAFGGVFLAGTFADVVEQEGEAEERQALGFGPQFGEALNGGIFGGGQFFEGFEGDEGVFVDGVAMVEVAGDEAFEVFPFGHEGREGAGFVHGAEGGGGVGLGEQVAPPGPGGRLLAEGDVAGDDAVFGFAGEAEAMTGEEGEEAEFEGDVGEAARAAEEDPIFANGEIGVGDAGAEVAKDAQQAAGGAFMPLDGAQGGPIDEPGMVEVGAHQGVGIGVETLLEVEGEDVGVALGGVVEAKTGAVEELAGGFEQQGIFAQPVEQVEIAQATGPLFEVGLKVIDGVLKLVVPGGGEAAEVAIEHIPFGFEELG